MSVSRPNSPHHSSHNGSTESLEDLFSDVKIGGQPVAVQVSNTSNDVPASVAPPADQQSHSEITASQMLAQASGTSDKKELAGATASIQLHENKYQRFALLLIDAIKHLTGHVIPSECLNSIFTPSLYHEIYQQLNALLGTENEDLAMSVLNAYSQSGDFKQEMIILQSFQTAVSCEEAASSAEPEKTIVTSDELFSLLIKFIPDLSFEEMLALFPQDKFNSLHAALTPLVKSESTSAVMCVLNGHCSTQNFMRSLFTLRKKP